MITVSGLLAIALYLATTGYLFVATRSQSLAAGQPRGPLVVWLLALLAHLGVLLPLVVTESGLNLCLGNALSASLWLVAALLWLTAWRHPLAILGVVILPLAALAALVTLLCDGDTRYATSAGIDLHILFSALGWAFLALSMAQAAVMAAQHRALHNHHASGFVRTLPPAFLDGGLAVPDDPHRLGVSWPQPAFRLMFVDNLLAQDLAHKTVLSTLAWVIFSILLLGRWRLGWRGTRALAWTTGGFVALVLAYFGSKLVLEIILGRV